MLFTLFLETGFFTNLATLTGYWVLGNPQSPCPPVLQLQTCVTWCGFFSECWGYKLRSHTCTADPLPILPSPQALAKRTRLQATLEMSKESWN